MDSSNAVLGPIDSIPGFSLDDPVKIEEPKEEIGKEGKCTIYTKPSPAGELPETSLETACKQFVATRNSVLAPRDSTKRDNNFSNFSLLEEEFSRLSYRTQDFSNHQFQDYRITEEHIEHNGFSTFMRHDRDRSGSLSVLEVFRALQDFAVTSGLPPINLIDAQALFFAFDSNHNGRISQDEFLMMLQSLRSRRITREFRMGRLF